MCCQSSGVGVHVKLEHNVWVVEADGLSEHVPLSHPKLSRATDHRQLPHRPAHHAMTELPACSPGMSTTFMV
jgi:hypothetical protein